MTLILHLTDLHLGDLAIHEDFDDYKSEIVPPIERVRRHLLLESTLKGISRYLSDNGMTLDSVVVTGDITVANDERGFEKFSSLLASLDPVCPPVDRIVVVPGNHDVTWGTPSSVPARYTHFIKHIREQGYVTPILDGIDVDEKGHFRRHVAHHVLTPDGDVLIVPLNSSNYSGMLEPLNALDDREWESIPDLIDPARASEIMKELRRIRLHDVARISPQQLQAVSELIQSLDEEAKRSGSASKQPIRLLLLHHHLLPVSTHEEFKSFESISNLGLLRHFLRDSKIDIVLHGHKHAGFVYWDHIYDYNNPFSSPGGAQRVLVVSGSTIGGVDFNRAELCRLLTIDAKTTAAEVSIRSVAAVDPGIRTLAETASRRLSLWQGSHATRSEPVAQVIDGSTLDETYDRIRSVFNDISPLDPANNIICRVHRVERSVRLPNHYPEIPGRDESERQIWFDQMVKWWQRRKTSLSERFGFTHGQRIYSYGESSINQVTRAAEALKAKKETSRALIALVNPGLDDVASTRQFPAVCSIQFAILRDRDGQLKLDCTAYFRKQEMLYWWPVNIAELSSIRNEVFNRVRSTHETLQLGSITTVAAMAYGNKTCPKLAVPEIDRLLDESPDTLWEMAYVLAAPDVVSKDRLISRWNEILVDLIPTEFPDPNGVPIALEGLKKLSFDIASFARVHRSSALKEISSILEQLHQLNRAYASATRVDLPTEEQHAEWRGNCLSLIEQLRRTLTLILGT